MIVDTDCLVGLSENEVSQYKQNLTDSFGSLASADRPRQIMRDPVARDLLSATHLF